MKAAIICVGKCIDKVDELLRNYDEDNEVQSETGFHTNASADKDHYVIVNSLIQI